ncbi:hypothetical protein EDD15DRAFT_2193721 [Pisolithus albus]|nr:hypothetical protein EDD15DRAFT_2193721 [Pisolithus albus]
MDTAPDFYDEVLLSLEDLVKLDPHSVQSSNGLTCVPLHRVLDVAYKLFQKHANLESLAEHRQYCPLDLELGTDNVFNASQILALILHSFSSSTSVEKLASLFLDSEGRDDAATCQFADKVHSPLERRFEDVFKKVSEVNEIQGQPAGDKHVIAAKVESMQHTMKNVGETLRDHEGQLSALDDTQRRVAEEFSNLEICLTSLQKNRIRKDVSLKDIQASLANLEANLASYRHDLRQQLKDKNNGLRQCISDSLTGLQSSQLSLEERLTILEKKAIGIQTVQDKHTGLFSQALAGIHSLSQGFVTLLDHTQDIGVIRTALRDMQEAMESVKKSLEQISGDSSSDVSQSWAHPQLSLTEELLCSTHGFPITPPRVRDDGEVVGLEDLLQPTTGVDGAASSGDDHRSLAATLYHYSVTVIFSVIPVVSIQSAILLSISQCRILHNKLSGVQLRAFILASVTVTLVFIGFFSALRGSLPKTQEVVDRPLWYTLRYGGLPSIVR